MFAVSIMYRWCLGGVLVVSRYRFGGVCLGGVPVVPGRLCLGGRALAIVSHWCLGGVSIADDDGDDNA